MANLPTIIYPIYTTTIPSTKQPVKYRPYTGAEEKVFLTAAESDDPEQIKDALVAVIGAATNSLLDISKLTTFDIEWMFLQLRGRSIGEKLKASVQLSQCPNNENRLCKETTRFVIDLDKVKLLIKDGDKTTDFAKTKFKDVANIKLNDNLAVAFRYPGFEDFDVVAKFNGSEEVDTDEIAYELMSRCAVTLFDKEVKYPAKDSTIEELKKWFKDLDKESLKPIEEFFKKIPSLSYTTTIKCQKCDRVQEYTLEGLNDFFA